MKMFLQRFLRDERALTTVEYAVAGGLIVAGLVLSFTTLGDKVKAMIDGIVTAL